MNAGKACVKAKMIWQLGECETGIYMPARLLGMRCWRTDCTWWMCSSWVLEENQDVVQVNKDVFVEHVSEDAVDQVLEGRSASPDIYSGQWAY